MTLAGTQAEQDLVQQLIRLAGADAPAGGTPAEAVDYDWRIPSRFLVAEVKKLGEFGQDVAARVSAGLGGLLGAELKIAAAPLKQSYAVELRKSLSENRGYSVPLALEAGQPCGLVLLPLAQALGWVKRLLGASADEGGDDKELSAVEQGLLFDVFQAVVVGLSAASKAAGGPGFRREERLFKGQGELPGEDSDEYCQFSFSPEEAGQEEGISVLVLSDAVAGIAGAAAGKEAAKSGEQIRKDLIAHLENVTIEAAARLGTARVPLREILSLEPGDVLVTDTRVDEPIELLVQGKAVLSGFPARSSGQYALKIAGPGQNEAEG